MRVVVDHVAIDRLDTAPARRHYAEEALAVMQQIAPVRTGALRRSGHIEDGAESTDIVFDPRGPKGESYAGYVEKGTRYMEAQPFMLPAVSRRYS
jgi:HK97 gp10 family phage protein